MECCHIHVCLEQVLMLQWAENIEHLPYAFIDLGLFVVYVLSQNRPWDYANFAERHGIALLISCGWTKLDHVHGMQTSRIESNFPSQEQEQEPLPTL